MLKVFCINNINFKNIFFTVVVFFLFYNIFILPKQLLYYFFLLVLLYIFLNMWFYFSIIYKNSTYTTSVQRFWKRTYSIFWIIEFFLFGIFLYFWAISPQESSFFIDSFNQNNLNPYYKKEYILYIFIVLYIITLIHQCKFAKKKNVFFYPQLLIVFFIINYLLVQEWFKFLHSIALLCFLKPFGLEVFINVGTSTFSSGESSFLSHSFLASSELSTLDKKIKRTSTFFLTTLSILKFWHFVFIAILLSLSIGRILVTKSISMDVISSNYQNQVYILIFFLLNFMVFFKQYIYFFLKWNYFWFLENNNFQKKISFFFFEILLIIPREYTF